MVGWRGTPGVAERPERVRVRRSAPLGGAGIVSPRTAAAFRRGWVTVAPDGGVWTHTEDGDEHVIDAREVEKPPSEGTSRTRAMLAAHTSDDGRFLAVVNDYGSTGVVLDLTTRTTVLRLDRGRYHTRQTPFPLTFVATEDRGTVLVAATAWNRLDGFEPGSGHLLKVRDTVVRQEGRVARPRCGFFHGALHASPDGRWMLDDGWVWAPQGQVRTWSIERWFGGNLWESDDGSSLVVLAHRWYLWDAPMCWIDDRRVAIWGLGNDDEAMIDGITIYDAPPPAWQSVLDLI